ncbi:MAG: hypothetical protein AAF549_09580 [Pseudomonadota bacterium]
MSISLSALKILKSEFTKALRSKKWLEKLLIGDLYGFEQELHEWLLGFYDKICSAMIKQVSSSIKFEKIQREISEKRGLKKLSLRSVELQLRTGTKIRYDSLYAKQVPKGYEGCRHLSHIHWRVDQKSGLMYQSLSCLLSVICPSFMLSKSVLNYQGIHANFDRIRKLSLTMAHHCKENRTKIQIKDGETLAGKRVLIAIDGGRTRMRQYDEENQKGRSAKYTTPWQEPKLFVITTIDKNGKANKEELPIYDSCFGDDETFEILEQYLKELEIDKAKDVQFVADGALWIWNRVKPMLTSLGVKEDKILETLDYYHAMEHLYELFEYIEKDQKESISKKLKQALWQGDIKKIKRLVKKGIPGVDLEQFNPYKYFYKNRNRIDYQKLRKEKRPCGSGVIESGIRRIINMRFKCPSTFWYPENVERLILMRSIALSGRWETMLNNLTKIRA